MKSQEFEKNDYVNEIRKTKQYFMYSLLVKINEAICARMKQKMINQKEFALKLGVSSAYISKILNGKPNLSIKSLVDIAFALDLNLNINLTPSFITLAQDTKDDFENDYYGQGNVLSKTCKGALENEERYLLAS